MVDYDSSDENDLYNLDSDNSSIGYGNYGLDDSYDINHSDSDDEEQGRRGGRKCRYGENCLYRTKCRFRHTEKEKQLFAENKMYLL